MNIACPAIRPYTNARDFLAHANRIVDQLNVARAKYGVPALSEDQVERLQTDYLVEYLKRRYPERSSRRSRRRTLPARFRREPEIFLNPMRFGRTRLFLSYIVGDLAWRGWRSL